MSGKINFRDTENNESIFVEFNDEKVVWDKNIGCDVMPKETVEKYLPKGYELVDGLYTKGGGEKPGEYFIYAEVKKIPETKTVKINYYDETAEKQAAEVAVEVSKDAEFVDKAILTRFLPEGYNFKGADCVIRDGYVYVAVEAIASETKDVHLVHFNVENDENVGDAVITVEQKILRYM